MPDKKKNNNLTFKSFCHVSWSLCSEVCPDEAELHGFKHWKREDGFSPCSFFSSTRQKGTMHIYWPRMEETKQKKFNIKNIYNIYIYSHQQLWIQSSDCLGQTLRLLILTDSSVKATFRREGREDVKVKNVHFFVKNEAHKVEFNLPTRLIVFVFILTKTLLGFQLFQPLRGLFLSAKDK